MLGLASEPAPAPGAVPLLVDVMRDGARIPAGQASLADARARFEEQWAGLPDRLKRLRDPDRYEVTIGPGLDRATREWTQDG